MCQLNYLLIIIDITNLVEAGRAQLLQTRNCNMSSHFLINTNYFRADIIPPVSEDVISSAVF